MTCRRTLSLLEDYLDRELPDDSIAEVEKHIESCDLCRAEFREAESLGETLRNMTITAPEQEYQQQTLELILARTAAADQLPSRDGPSQPPSPADNIGFMRSIASFAIAVSVLLSAILIGLESPNDQGSGLISQELTATPAAFNNILIEEENGPFTQAEWNRLTGVMLMMGSPGLIRKSIIVNDLTPRSR